VKLENNNDGSYSVVFTPVRAVTHQLHVQLFGIALDSSPMDIPVVSEPVVPVQSNSRPNDQSGGACSQHNSSTPVVMLDSPAPKFTVPCSESFDDDDYFALVASQCSYSPVSHVPGSASKGNWSTPVKQADKDRQDRGDFEEVRRSMKRMTVDPVLPNDSRRGGWPSSVDRTQVDDFAPSHGSARVYTNGEFEDPTCEDFDSTGLFYFYYLCSAGDNVFISTILCF